MLMLMLTMTNSALPFVTPEHPYNSSAVEVLLDDARLKMAESNPAVAYLLSLGSKRSRLTMGSFLGSVASLLKYPDIFQCPWSALRRFHVQAVVEMLQDAGKAPATINTYLSALKGVAMEAWTLKLIDTDTHQHIKHIRSVRGARLPKGRALSAAEVKKLFLFAWCLA